MAELMSLSKIKTIDLNELSELLEKAESIETREEVSGFVVHKILLEGESSIVLPSPKDNLFFVVPE